MIIRYWDDAKSCEDPKLRIRKDGKVLRTSTLISYIGARLYGNPEKYTSYQRAEQFLLLTTFELVFKQSGSIEEFVEIMKRMHNTRRPFEPIPEFDIHSIVE